MRHKHHAAVTVFNGEETVIKTRRNILPQDLFYTASPPPREDIKLSLKASRNYLSISDPLPTASEHLYYC